MPDYPRLGVHIEHPDPPPAQPQPEPPMPLPPPPSSAWGGPDGPGPALPSTGDCWLDALEADYQADMRAIMRDWSVVGVDLWAALGRGLYATTRQDANEKYSAVAPTRTFTTRVRYRFRRGNLSWRGFLVWALTLSLAAVLLVALVAAIVRGGWW